MDLGSRVGPRGAVFVLEGADPAVVESFLQGRGAWLVGRACLVGGGQGQGVGGNDQDERDLEKHLVMGCEVADVCGGYVDVKEIFEEF